MLFNRHSLFNLILIFESIVLVIVLGMLLEKLENNLHLYFFSVGEGDAIVIRTPDKKTVLIDGGPDQTVLEKIGFVVPVWDRTIDVLIVTHPDSDHLTGALEVLQTHPVNLVIETNIPKASSIYTAWEQYLTKHQTPRVYAGYLDSIHLIDTLNIALFTSTAPKQDNSNTASIITRVSYKNFDTLLLADLEKLGEQELLKTSLASPSEVFKVAHHGSKTSTSESLVTQLAPLFAVISCGEQNPYGHPHQETLETLTNHNIQTLRTDIQGDIEIISNGENFWIRTEKV